MSHPFSDEIKELLKTHFDHLTKSAISVDVIRERGYRTVMGKKELADCGFSKSQQRYPGILIPLHGVGGDIVGHQYRPDRPRTGARERIIKYENPAGSSVRLDVPPRCQPQIGNPSTPLWITEGVKKVDALATAGACAIGLTGVWGFKGKNIFGGTTFLADFDYITFKDRLVYLVFDSDSQTNPLVAQALSRLAEHLSRKGAKIRKLQLPTGPADVKTGADDYLARGHTLEDLIGLEDMELPAPAKPAKEKYQSDEYLIESGRLCWNKPTNSGPVVVPLCNFTAKVTADVLRDNGLEAARHFKVIGKMGDGQSLPEVEIPSTGFNAMSWVTGEWGMRAIIAAGQTHKDRLREAIQLLSQDAAQSVVYTHTGWREIDGEMAFLSGSGALGNERVSVELESPLQRYQLVTPEGDPVDAIKTSFSFHLVAPLEVTLPLWAAMYLAPLSEIIEPAFTLWVVGPSGAYKSTLTALALCHFGTFDMRHLPASWRDTHNQLEKLLFLAKDLPLVIDDWAPGQDSAKARELEVKAEYIVRAQGNRQGRGRMRADTSSRPNYVPRGLLITSGEQLPGGHSHTARIYTIEIERSGVCLDFMSAAQEQHQQQYCVAMSHYINWLKPQWGDLKKHLPGKWRDLRDKAQQGSNHPRLPEAIASLSLAVEMVAEFAVAHKAISDSESSELQKTAWDIFYRLASQQAGRVEEERPGKRFIETLRTLIDQGKAVLWDKEDDGPRTAVPGTVSVGWNDGSEYILLNPTAVYQAVHEFGQRSGEPFTFKKNAVFQDLKRLGCIVSRNGRNTEVEKIYGRPMRVIKLKRNSLNDIIS